MSSGARTFIPALPASWRRYWLEHVFPRKVAHLQGLQVSVLDPLPVATAEVDRIKRFGHVWSWWGLPDDLKQHFRGLG